MDKQPKLKLVGGTTVSSDGTSGSGAPPGGGGGMSDFESRMKRVEEDAKEFRSDAKAIRIDLAEIEGKLSVMPSTWQIVGICAGLIGIVIASGGGLLAILRSFGAAFRAPAS